MLPKEKEKKIAQLCDLYGCTYSVYTARIPYAACSIASLEYTNVDSIPNVQFVLFESLGVVYCLRIRL